MNFRNAVKSDLPVIHTIENICFSNNQAASLETLSERIKTYPNHFWVLEIENEVVGFINGMVTNNETITDEMFSNVNLHTENGKWQSVFGLAVLPGHRKSGYAGKMIDFLIKQSKEQKKTGIILTCKEYLVSYYKKFGFENKGISNSVHGGEVWYDMVLKF